MSLPAGWPSLHEVESANWDHLKAASDQWPKLADQWESAFIEVRDQSMRPGGTDWEGSSADAVQARTDGDIAKVRGPAEQLREAAAVAGRAFGQQTSGQRAVLEAVDDAKRDGFNVGPDYIVTDTKTSYDSASERDDRAKAAQEHSDFIRYRVTNLVGGEGDIAGGITKATAGLDGLSFPDDAADGGAGALPGGKPSALQGPRNPAAARTDGAAGNAPGLPPGWQIVEEPVEPWYGQTPSPGVTQYMITAPDGTQPTVWELVRLGVLDEYGPPLGR